MNTLIPAVVSAILAAIPDSELANLINPLIKSAEDSITAGTNSLEKDILVPLLEKLKAELGSLGNSQGGGN
jgi:hypothetical protein